MKNIAWLSALSLVVCAGCDRSVAPDAGSDAGIDTNPFDTGSLVLDVPPGPDTGGEPDGGVDAAIDASCPPPLCEPPAPGCRYEGATACTCGTLVCEAGCDPACGAGFYCDLCAAEQACVEQPEDMGRICPAVWMPVCGCDGNTYSNGCALGSAGVGALHPGECRPECGTTTCEPGEYCNYAESCGGDGTCEPRGDGSCPEVYAPVCGCDGTTYDNACFAAAAGVSVERIGTCTPAETCSPPCNAGETCQPCEGPDGRVDYVCIPEGAAC